MATVRFSYLQRFRITLRKIGYTKAEANKIVVKIRKNKDNDGSFEHSCQHARNFTYMLGSAFFWRQSPEGDDYWCDLHTHLKIWENSNAASYL